MPGRGFALAAPGSAPTFADTAFASMSRLAVSLCLLALAACASTRDDATRDAVLPVATPVAPRNDAEALLAEALRYGFERPGDIPDRRMLAGAHPVPVQVEVWRPQNAQPPDTLTAHALPAGGRTRFALLPAADIKALARARGEFAYVTTSQPEVRGDTATVSVGVRKLVSVQPAKSARGDGLLYGGAGYTLQFVRRGGGWVALGPVLYVSS